MSEQEDRYKQVTKQFIGFYRRVLTIGSYKKRVQEIIKKALFIECLEMSTQQMPTRIEHIGMVVKTLLQLTVGLSLRMSYDNSTIFDMLESISLNQIELRRDLKETISAVSQKDEKERDSILDYLEKRMERDEKQVQEALSVANKNAKIIKWVSRDLQDKAKVYQDTEKK
jgi:hypothetical protein